MNRFKPTKLLEDRLGKLAMLLIFGVMGYKAILSLGMMILHRNEIPLWGLALMSQATSTGFLVVILYYTMVRLPPVNSAAGLAPRIVAIVGTFIMSILIIMPADAISEPVRILSSLLAITGAGLSTWCLHQLGRSFSIMASSRELKTEGSYSVVRHPLYAAEVLLIAGVVVGHGTLVACGIGAVWLVLQIRRAQYEEMVLRETFPEYADYARRVPMLIPGLRLAAFEESLHLKPKQS